MKKHKPHFDVLNILTRNGWQWLCYEKDMLSTTTEYTQYKADFLGHSYSSTVVAIISNLPEHLNLDGHYGVLWLEAVYECERDGCLSWGDITDMQQAIIYAEENLLRIGMPFTPDYNFHGRNAANMKRRNRKLRRLYNMDEVEKKAEKWEEEYHGSD